MILRMLMKIPKTRLIGFFEKEINDGYAEDMVAFKCNSDSWKAVVNEHITFKDFISIADNWYAQEYNGERYRFTLDEMRTHWQIILIQRVHYKYHRYYRHVPLNPALAMLGVWDIIDADPYELTQ